MKSKKKNRRSRIKNPALIKRYNSRIRQEYIDMDYLDKLDNTIKNCKLPDGTLVTQLEYMNYFMKEYNNAEVGKQSESHKNKIHRTAKEVKECTDRNNARNRDQYARAKAKNLVNKLDYDSLNQLIEDQRVFSINTTEDVMIEILDRINETDDTTSESDK